MRKRDRLCETEIPVNYTHNFYSPETCSRRKSIINNIVHGKLNLTKLWHSKSNNYCVTCFYTPITAHLRVSAFSSRRQVPSSAHARSALYRRINESRASLCHRRSSGHPHYLPKRLVSRISDVWSDRRREPRRSSSAHALSSRSYETCSRYWSRSHTTDRIKSVAFCFVSLVLVVVVSLY